MQSENPSPNSLAIHPIRRNEKFRVERSDTIGVQVVCNKQGWHVNVSINKAPSRHYGPFDEPLTLSEAMVYVSTILKLE